jgi:transcription antitermination factor NusG
MGSKYKKIKKVLKTKGNIVKKKKAIKKKRKKDNQSIQKEFLKLNYRFKNNDEKWLTILLTENCVLLESYKLIEKELEDIFGDDVIYFMPIYLDEKVPGLGIQLFDGYIFVKCANGITESTFSRKTDYLDRILKKGSNAYFTTNRTINKFKTQLKKDLEKRIPCKGTRVISNEGTFKNQEGIVKSVNKRKKTAIVEFHKRTRIVTAKLSVINFDKI